MKLRNRDLRAARKATDVARWATIEPTEEEEKEEENDYFTLPDGSIVSTRDPWPIQQMTKEK